MYTLDALYTTASVLKGREAMKGFLRDLLTESERIMLGRRILIARMLLSGNSYDDIAQELGVGYDTVSRVGRWLSDQMPGYEHAIEEMEKEFDRREEKRRIGRMYHDQSLSGVIARLKKKYPIHFLLMPWPDRYAPTSRKKDGAYKSRRSKSQGKDKSQEKNKPRKKQEKGVHKNIL